MVVDNLFSVIHAVVADLDGTAIKDFSKFVVFREEAAYTLCENAIYASVIYFM